MKKKALFVFLLGCLSFQCLLTDNDKVFDDETCYDYNVRQLYKFSKGNNLAEIGVDSSKLEFLGAVLGGLGAGQCSIDLPTDKKLAALTCIRQAIYKTMSYECIFYDSISWQESPFEVIKGKSNLHHGAYLGYLNLLLSMHSYLQSRLLKYGKIAGYEKDSVIDSYNKIITEKLLEMVSKSGCGILQTYPSQAFPTDGAAILGSVGLYYKAYNIEYPETFKQMIKKYESVAIDKVTGLLNYYVDYTNGESDGTLRGSGSAVAMYFISFADIDLSRKLYNSIIKNLKDTVYRVHGIRECLRDIPDDEVGMDTDTGPVIFGLGTTATGFTIAGARIHKDKKTFVDLTETAWKVGIPVKNSSGIWFSTVGKFENAAMFAVLTAKIFPFNQ